MSTPHPSTLLRAYGSAILLGLLVMPAACDRSATAPESRPAPSTAASHDLFPITKLPSPAPDFDASQYFAIDVNRAAQQQYGASATAVLTTDHLYGWKASVAGRLFGIDMARAVADQYGTGYVLAAVGVAGYDWRAVRWSGLNSHIVPVMPVASDLFWDVNSVRTGLANFKSVLLTIRNWYSYRAGQTFHYVQPLVVFLQSTQTAAQWNALAELSTDPNHRYDFMNAAIGEYRRSYPQPGSALKAVIVPFTGASPDIWHGAASTSGIYAVSPPRASSITCPASGSLDARCADATYAIGHELGHTFGLQHACDAYPSDPNCGNSIMQTGKPWDAILLSGEINTLTPQSFFW
jgi:hypothetical protein